MRHWTYWEFERLGITLTTRWGKLRDGTHSPYQTLFSVGRFRIHCFHRGDGDPDPHDHMWDFVTFPLTSYVEKWYPRLVEEDGHGVTRVVRRGRFHKRPAEYAHIVKGKFERDAFPDYVEGRIWTLVWVGKKRRDWGFWTGGDTIRWYSDQFRKWRWEKRPLKWIPWRTYIGEEIVETVDFSFQSDGVSMEIGDYFTIDEPIKRTFLDWFLRRRRTERKKFRVVGSTGSTVKGRRNV